jgi:2'-5' RNA ligase
MAQQRTENQSDSLIRQLAIIAHPRFNETDSAWLEAIRRQYDPQAELVPAHLTLMFPVVAPVASLLAQANRCAAGNKVFDIRITQVHAHRDAKDGWSYIFALPTIGSEQITALHDNLYSGEFRKHMRQDLTYQPHITIAKKTDYSECASLASSLNRGGINILGRIDSIRVVSVEPDAITPVAEFDLGCAAVGNLNDSSSLGSRMMERNPTEEI